MAVGIHLIDEREFDVTPAIPPTMRGQRDVTPHRTERNRRVLVNEDLDVRGAVTWPLGVEDDVWALDCAFDLVSFRLYSHFVAIIETIKLAYDIWYCHCTRV